MLRILYGVYFVVLAMFMLNAFSWFFVSRRKTMPERVRYFIATTLRALVWPVFLFSSGGWKRLTRMWDEI